MTADARLMLTLAAPFFSDIGKKYASTVLMTVAHKASCRAQLLAKVSSMCHSQVTDRAICYH